MSLTKRLHISGLTPSITPADLERRLSVFGKVKAMDGFGARDALGDPRKFGFVTMEIGAKELAKCFNVLSGSTWKGTKLRIGEARPDFRERIAQINNDSQTTRPVRPKRTRPRHHGRLSSTLPLTPLSATVAASTPGWIVTPSGRVVRPMRMRPERPLEPTRSELSASKVNGANGRLAKVKKRVKPPPIRARRRLIDPMKWDSVYLKGVYLESVSVPLPAPKDALRVSMNDDKEEEGVDEDSDASSSVVRDEVEPSQLVPRSVQARTRVTASSQQSHEAFLSTSPRVHEVTESIDLREEANAALAMLDQIFGDREDWGGSESVDEMDGLGDNKAKEEAMQVAEEDGIEIVHRDLGEGEGRRFTRKDKGKEKSAGESVRFGREDVGAARDEIINMAEIVPPASNGMSTRTAQPAVRANLKDLFAPREEASFSLLSHLDLDLELDGDILGIGAPSGTSQDDGRVSEPTLPTPQAVQILATTSTSTTTTTKARARATLDPSLPLLFPPPESLPHPYCASSSIDNPSTMDGARPHCVLFPPSTTPLARRLHHLNLLPPSITFARSPEDTPESIRERWERDKSALTHAWKKAWREARGSRRGRGGGEVGGGY